MSEYHLEYRYNGKRTADDYIKSIKDAPPPYLSKYVKTSHTILEGEWWRDAEPIRLQHADYNVGWICALPIELAASHAMLDRVHETIPTVANDTNAYILGNIGTHNVVMACLPFGQYGTNPAATVAANMMRSFKSIRFGFMVGIGGGVPDDMDIRLGDVVVGTQVLQHDLGKIIGGEKFQGTGTPRIPPQILLNAVSKLRALHEATNSSISSILHEMHERYQKLTEYSYPTTCEDLLFRVIHEDHHPTECDGSCPSELQLRPQRKNQKPKIHYGAIASGNQVIKCGHTRDSIAGALGVICFEMEAAGLTDVFPCLVIRGICDYADSHKSKEWQRYAAATAAACAKEVISVINPNTESIESKPGQYTIDHIQCIATDVMAVKEKKRRMENHPGMNRDRNLRERHRSDLLRWLHFPQIDARRDTIGKAHSKTCDWLLQDSSYTGWVDTSRAAQHKGFLWIIGKPGAGKSTMMKFAYNCARKIETSGTPTTSFFFNARGDRLEKTTSGLYRSLLYQLLIKFPDLQTVFDDESLVPFHKQEDLATDVVQELYRNAVLSLGQRRLTCFVDGLDECDETQVRNMVVYFEELAEEAISHNIQHHICFSSRHYPHIDIRQGLVLVLEQQPGHDQDLHRYVQSHLRAGEDPNADGIRKKILEKAGGVFMWVVLVVEMLNIEFGHGNRFRVPQKLREMPTELGELFKAMLSRDDGNMEEFLLCVQWILFATRPLSRREFYYAVLSGLPDCQQEALAHDPEADTDDRMDVFVTSYSKGLAEVTKSDFGTVQFIHESVNEFFIKNNGIEHLWPGVGTNFQAFSHEKLKACCHRYIQLQSSLDISLYGASGDSQMAKGAREKTSAKSPFLEYATNHVLYHANIAAETVSQDRFLDNFSERTWIHFANAFTNDCTHRYTPTATLPYILVDRNFTRLLEGYVRRNSIVYQRGEWYGSPFFAALANGHRIAAKTLLGQAADGTPLEELFPQKDYKQIFKSKRASKTSPLHWAIETHQYTLTKLMIDSGHFDCKLLDSMGRSPIHTALIVGDKAVISMLAGNKGFHRKPADSNQDDVANHRIINCEDWEGKTVLHVASDHGNETMAKFLIANGANVNSKDITGQTPLHSAAGYGHEAVVKLLLENGALIDSKDAGGKTPVYRADVNHQPGIVKLLIDKGASADSLNSQSAPSPGMTNLMHFLRSISGLV